jgi:hypothetical protein
MPERNGRARSEQIRDTLRTMADDWNAAAEATVAVEQFNARLSAKKFVWAWPTIAAALISKHHWLIVACDSCGTVIDLDLRVKRRDPAAPISTAPDDVRCPRCNGHGRTRISNLARFPSIY